MRKYIREEFEKQRHVQDTVHPLMKTRDRQFSHLKTGADQVSARLGKGRDQSHQGASQSGKSRIYISGLELAQ